MHVAGARDSEAATLARACGHRAMLQHVLHPTRFVSLATPNTADQPPDTICEVSVIQLGVRESNAGLHQWFSHAWGC
ncbi:hypothetical protein M407DRAFT_245151 [Tulasnella calospora MUT 4182]|uniref:Uncharacterized protein n=1 Tax=Tulasnella calospora MUT 4182 TaxID=1051891 RepID=A0A0C3QCW8_9AGAM|nr:hypothetical protein M407DRAFT_245151 [Tulasnella calospora MUT 4182]